MPEITSPLFNSTLVLPGFEVVGQIEPIGPWIDFLNSKDKHVLPVYTARVLPIGGAATTPERAQVFVSRSEVLLLHLPDPSGLHMP